MISQTPSGSESSGSDSGLLPGSGSPTGRSSSLTLGSRELSAAVSCSMSSSMRRPGTGSHGPSIRGSSHGPGKRLHRSSSIRQSSPTCKRGGRTVQTVGAENFVSRRPCFGIISIRALALAHIIQIDRQGHHPSAMGAGASSDDVVCAHPTRRGRSAIVPMI